MMRCVSAADPRLQERGLVPVQVPVAPEEPGRSFVYSHEGGLSSGGGGLVYWGEDQ